MITKAREFTAIQRDMRSLVEEYQSGEIRKPPFQRDVVAWSRSQRRFWCIWMIEESKHNVPILLYNLPGSTERYIADGLQRLHAASEFIKNPASFVRGMSYEEVIGELKKFFVVVISDIYEDHMDAMKAFQRANMGTALNAMEFFKGLLTAGGGPGVMVYENIPSIVKEATAPYVIPWKSRSRGKESTFVRSALAMFLQYVSGSKTKSMWGAHQKKINLTRIDDSLEARLTEWINGEEEGLPKCIDQFRSFISGRMNKISKIAHKHVPGTKLTLALAQNMLHTALYYKNCSYKNYYAYVDAHLKHQVRAAREKGYFVGMLVFAGNNGKADKVIPMPSTSIVNLERAARELGVEVK